ncbi:MAG: hypothetical protein KAI72_01870 [Candidatus Pacebacteria bacterium]|nr:hypothetical protein [Candidatus Paceibacterota bacterium]
MEFNDAEKKIIETAEFLGTKTCKNFRKKLWAFACFRLSLLSILVFLLRENNEFILAFLILILVSNFFRGLKNNAAQRKLYSFIYKITKSRGKLRENKGPE